MEEVLPFTFEVLPEHLYVPPIREADDDANDLSAAEQKLSLDTNFCTETITQHYCDHQFTCSLVCKRHQLPRSLIRMVPCCQKFLLAVV